MKVWIAHDEGRRLLGPVPAGVRIEVCPDATTLPSDPADVRFWVPPFTQTVRATSLLPKFSGLDVVQLLSAGADNWIGQVPPGVLLCDARGVHDAPVAEWVLGATIGALRQFPAFARAQERQEWGAPGLLPTRELTGARVLLVGHPLWRLPNLLLTPHVGGAVRGLLPRAYDLAGAQLRRFAAGQELINQVTAAGY